MKKIQNTKIRESEYTDDYIDWQMRMNRTVDDGEWIRRKGSWDDRMKYELGLIGALGEQPKYPSSIEGLNRLVDRASGMLEYYTDPKRAADKACQLRARALRKIIAACEDRITNPSKYIEKQRAEAEKEYGRRTGNLRQSDTADILRRYSYPKDIKENVSKNIVKINEDALRKIIAESIKSVLKESGQGREREGFYDVELDFDAYKHAIGPEAPSDDEYLGYWLKEYELPDKVCVKFRIYVTEYDGDMDTPPYSSAELEDWDIDDDQLNGFGFSLRIIIERAVEYRMDDVDPDVLINYAIN